MAIGQSSNPLEAEDGTPATVKPQGNSETVVYVMDPEVKEHLGRIRELLEELVLLKKLS